MFEKECKLLRVAPEADAQTIRKAWERMVRRYPPERFPERFAAVQAARDTLMLEDSAVAAFVEECRTATNPLQLVARIMAPEDFPRPDFPDMREAAARAERALEVDAILADMGADGVELKTTGTEREAPWQFSE